MEERIFHVKMGLGNFVFTLKTESLSIKPPLGSVLEIRKEELKKIDFKTLSYPVPNIGYAYHLYIFYNRNGQLKKKTYIFGFQDQEAAGLVEALKTFYPEADYLGPNENEKKEVLSPSFRGNYRLHALWFTVWTLVLFLTFAPVSAVFLGFAENRRQDSGVAFGLVFGALAVLLVVVFVMLIVKKIYSFQTDGAGLKYRKLFSAGSLSWSEVSVGEISFREKVIRAEYSTSTDAFFLVPLSAPGRNKPLVLKITAETAGRFFAELYYRGKVSLEQARACGAFF